MPCTFDLHMHTTRYSPDSQINPFALVRRARDLGLSGVVITEHDCMWREDELDELRAAVPEVMIFGGVEVSAKEGHFLLHGVKDPTPFPRGVGVADLAREIHRQGGAIVAAHPFRWGQPFEEILRELQPELDALELMTSNMDSSCREKAAQVWREKGWTGLGSSDAHQVEVLGCCYTEFPQAIRDQRDLIDALRSGEAKAKDRSAKA